MCYTTALIFCTLYNKYLKRSLMSDIQFYRSRDSRCYVLKSTPTERVTTYLMKSRSVNMRDVQAKSDWQHQPIS